MYHTTIKLSSNVRSDSQAVSNRRVIEAKSDDRSKKRSGLSNFLGLRCSRMTQERIRIRMFSISQCDDPRAILRVIDRSNDTGRLLLYTEIRKDVLYRWNGKGITVLYKNANIKEAMTFSAKSYLRHQRDSLFIANVSGARVFHQPAIRHAALNFHATQFYPLLSTASFYRSERG